MNEAGFAKADIPPGMSGARVRDDTPSDDGVLPSSEAFLATIPEGAKACGYGGNA